jgi:SAM-dependent methyltransferase
METPDSYHPRLKRKTTPPDSNEHFNRYVEDFNLDIEKLRDKVILDIGSGSNPFFVSQLLEKGITQRAYAVDKESFFAEFDNYSEDGQKMYPKEEAEKSEVKKHYIRARAEALPFRPNSFDLILMRAVMLPEADLKKVFDQINILLRPGGEFKFYPVFRDSEHRKQLDEILAGIDVNKLEYEWKESNSYEGLSGKRYYRDMLVVRKK